MRDEGRTKQELIKALREATDYFEKLRNSLGDAVFSVKMPERVIKFANIAIEEVFGYTPGECIGRSTSIFYPDEQGYLDFGKKLKDALDKGQDVLRTEHTLKRKNGELFTAAITISFLMHDGRLDEVISIASDITERIRTQDEINKLNAELEQRVIERTSQLEAAMRRLEEDISRRKEAEEALLESKEFFHTSVESFIDGFAVFSSVRDDKGKIVDFRYEYINEAGCKMNQRDRDEHLGHTILELMPAHKESGLIEEYARVVETGKPLIRESALYGDVYGRDEMIKRYFDLRAVKLGDGFTVTWRDVSDRKKTEDIISLQYRIVSILAENADLNETLKSTLRTICEHIGWELGDVWYVDRDADLLRLGSVWYADSVDGSKLEAFRRNMVFKRGEGIIGLVWQQGKSVWIEDISVYSHILRARIVAGMGFKSAFAFPLTASGIVNGVMIFEGRTMSPPDIDLLNALSAISSQIGGFIEQKRIEGIVIKEKEFSQSLIDNLPGAVYLGDEKGNLLRWSKNVEHVTGYSAEEIERMNALDLVADEQKEYVAHKMQEVMTKGSTEVEINILTKSGEKIPHHFTGARIVIDNAPCFIAMGLDITERKEAEELLRKSEAKYRTLVDNLPQKIFLKDRDSVYLSCNINYTRDLKVMPDEIIGKSDYDFFMAELAEKYISDDKRVMASGKTEELDEGYIHDGKAITVHTIKTPVRDDNGNIVGILGIFWDVTEKKMLENELLKMQRLESLGVLAGGIAHDFNNLLSGVLGNISLAKMYLNPEDRAYKRLEEAEKASVRTKDLTGQLLTFAKGGEPVRKVISVTDLLKDSVGFGLSGSPVNCKLSIPDGLWPVNVDEGQIHQVINNLLINADQAMPGGGTIEITCKNTEVRTSDALPLDEGSYVKISIKDQGIGIPEPLLKRIFDPYFTTKEKGRGLGLATSYSILKRHNGLITVKSKENKGTTFHLYLPALPSASISREGSEEIVVSGKGRVLVMDDEDIVIQVAGEMLKALGYEVESAIDGLEAIKKYKDAKEKGKPFNAVIMDLTIPGGMGGKEAIVRLKEIDPDVRAIVASGYSNDPVISGFRGFGFSGSLTKPFRIEELSRTVHSVLNP